LSEEARENNYKEKILKHRESWLKLKVATRRYKPFKGKEICCSLFYDGVYRNYTEGRKQIYVPEYYEKVRNTATIARFRDLVLDGRDVIVVDFDGPFSVEGGVKIPLCLEVTRDLLIEKINDETSPFGHGYVVGAILAGIPEDWYQI
jgi:hypothetical protein